MKNAVLINCVFGFFGFQDSKKKYRIARLDDHDTCAPNGFITIEWGLNPCGPEVTESTGDYATSHPVGSVFLTDGNLKLDIVDSDTFSYFISYCPFPDQPDVPVKISWTLSEKL